MISKRRTWQHVFEDVSENQLSELMHYKMGWIVERLGRDYGEDLYVRIFDDGNPTGHDFFVQLKGTDDVEQYALRSEPSFSYGFSLNNVKQWKGFILPVILILWDLEQGLGFWVHAQPLIEEKLQKTPDWLLDTGGAKKPERKLRIPRDNILDQSTIHLLKETIDKEYKKTRLGRRYFERIHIERTEVIRQAVAPRAQIRSLDIPEQSASLPLPVEQQLLVTQYKAATFADPSDVNAWLGLAHVHYELGELDKAMAAINNAWALNKEEPQIINARACTLAEYAMDKNGPKSLLHEAIELFDSIRDRVEAAGSTDYNIGNCYAGLGEHQKAIEHYEEALLANPKPDLASQIWKNRGTSFHYLDNIDEEIRSYKESIKSKPRHWKAYSSWAASELARGNFEEAKNLFSKALDLNADLETYGYAQLYSLAYTLWRLGELQESYSRVNQVLDIKPEHSDAQLLKLHLLSDLWRLDPLYTTSAISFFKYRILDKPDNVFLQSELYLLYNSEELVDDADLLMEQTDLDKTPVELLYRYARLLETERNIPEAIRYLESAFKRCQDHHVVHALARLKKEIGEYQSAIDYYGLALKDVGDPLSILRRVADCYYFLGDFVGCALTVSRSILLGSIDSSVWDNLMFALLKLGLSRLHISTYIAFLNQGLQSKEGVSDKEIMDKLDDLGAELI